MKCDTCYWKVRYDSWDYCALANAEINPVWDDYNWDDANCDDYQKIRGIDGCVGYMARN